MKNNNMGDLISFINDGKLSMDALAKSNPLLQKKDDIVLVVGTTGTGKSTLINYLNGVKLESVYKDYSWKIALIDENNKLPGGFDIGHDNSRSETLYPGIYSPENKSYSYIDCPGFGDSRGMQIDIANLFFREYVTKNAKNIKILLAVSGNEFINSAGKGGLFFKCLKDLSNFLGIFRDDENISKLKTSISLVVTQVECENSPEITKLSDEIKKQEEKLDKIQGKTVPELNTEIKHALSEKEVQKLQKLEKKAKKLEKKAKKLKTTVDTNKDKLNEFQNKNYLERKEYIKNTLKRLIDKEGDVLTKNEKDTLLHIINNNKLSFFSNPKKVQNLEDKEKEEITNILENEIKFLDRDVAKIRTVAPENYAGELINCLNEEKTSLKREISDEFKNGIKDSIKRSLNEIIDEKGASSIKANLEQLKEITDQPQGLLEFIDSISSKLLSKESQEKLTGKAEIVKILAGLLPESYQNQFGYKQNYLQAFELRTLIENQISNIDKICAAETIKFESGEVSCYGYFVKASSIASKVSSDTIITTENLKVLKVYAFGSFIIDCNLSDRKLGSSNLTVIAPKWNVTITNAKINLSGLDQDQYPEGREKALSGTIAGSNGEGGLAGLPGYYGGNFFGFGNVFKNEGNLELVSNGGKGGMGQNGGDGVEGQKGIDALISDVDVKSSSIPKSNKSHATSEIIEYYYKEGSVGKKGGIGGVGGLGGKGGSGGCIKICDVQKNSVMSIKSQSSPGNDGVSGDRGADGFHGLYGDKAIKIYYKKEIIPRDQNTYSLKMICKGWKESYMKQVTERFKTEKLVDISKQVGKLAESAKAPIINEQEELIAYKKFFEDFGTGFFNLDLEFPFNEVNFDGMVLSSALIGESDDGF